MAARANNNQYAFSRDFKKKGMIKLSTYLRNYKYASPNEWIRVSID